MESESLNYGSRLALWIALLTIVAAPASQIILNKQSVNREYVGIAVSILQDKNSDQKLKEWAIKVLDKKSPVRFSEDLISELGSGSILFPMVEGLFELDPGVLDFSPIFDPSNKTIGPISE